MHTYFAVPRLDLSFVINKELCIEAASCLFRWGRLMYTHTDPNA